MSAWDDRVSGIRKLEGDNNWPIWRARIKAYLEAQELWGIVDGSEVQPVEGVAALAKYKTKAAKVRNVLYQTMDDGILHLVMKSGLDTPKDQWDALVEHFDRPSLSNKLQLMQRLLNLRMDPGESTDKYFAEFQDINERLARLKLGEVISPDFSVAILLNGLPKEYEVLRTSFVTKGAVSITELQEGLRNEQSREEKRENPNAVLWASGRSDRGREGSHNGANPPPKGPKCWTCGGIGHISTDCGNNRRPQSNKVAAVEESWDDPPQRTTDYYGFFASDDRAKVSGGELGSLTREELSKKITKVSEDDAGDPCQGSQTLRRPKRNAKVKVRKTALQKGKKHDGKTGIQFVNGDPYQPPPGDAPRGREYPASKVRMKKSPPLPRTIYSF
jgi:hypothetical protein